MHHRCRHSCLLQLFLALLTAVIVLYSSFFLAYSSTSRLIKSKDMFLLEMETPAENGRALKKAKDYIFTKPKEFFRQQDFIKTEHPSLIAFTIITVRRTVGVTNVDDMGYLTRVVADFSAVFEKHQRSSKSQPAKLLLCNVDKKPQEHLEAQRIVSHMGVLSLSRNYTDDAIVDVFEKEGQDYMFCMNETFTRFPSAKYVVLVEDDAVPHDDMLDILLCLIDTVVERKRGKDIAFMKLYFPYHIQNYISDQFHRYVELVCIATVIATFLTLCLARLNGFTLNRSLLCLWLTLFFHVGIILSVVDRVYILKLRSMSSYLYSVVPTPSCCEQAVLFTRKNYPAVLTFLTEEHISKHRKKDITLDSLPYKTKLQGKLAEPNLFSHIGLYSSLRRRNFESNPRYMIELNSTDET